MLDLKFILTHKIDTEKQNLEDSVELLKSMNQFLLQLVKTVAKFGF